jgi:hypothetical protein
MAERVGMRAPVIAAFCLGAYCKNSHSKQSSWPINTLLLTSWPITGRLAKQTKNYWLFSWDFIQAPVFPCFPSVPPLLPTPFPVRKKPSANTWYSSKSLQLYSLVKLLPPFPQAVLAINLCGQRLQRKQLLSLTSLSYHRFFYDFSWNTFIHRGKMQTDKMNV